MMSLGKTGLSLTGRIGATRREGQFTYNAGTLMIGRAPSCFLAVKAERLGPDDDPGLGMRAIGSHAGG